MSAAIKALSEDTANYIHGKKWPERLETVSSGTAIDVVFLNGAALTRKGPMLQWPIKVMLSIFRTYYSPPLSGQIAIPEIKRAPTAPTITMNSIFTDIFNFTKRFPASPAAAYIWNKFIKVFDRRSPLLLAKNARDIFNRTFVKFSGHVHDGYGGYSKQLIQLLLKRAQWFQIQSKSLLSWITPLMNYYFSTHNLNIKQLRYSRHPTTKDGILKALLLSIFPRIRDARIMVEAFTKNLTKFSLLSGVRFIVGLIVKRRQPTGLYYIRLLNKLSSRKMV